MRKMQINELYVNRKGIIIIMDKKRRQIVASKNGYNHLETEDEYFDNFESLEIPSSECLTQITDNIKDSFYYSFLEFNTLYLRFIEKDIQEEQTSYILSFLYIKNSGMKKELIEISLEDLQYTKIHYDITSKKDLTEFLYENQPEVLGSYLVSKKTGIIYAESKQNKLIVSKDMYGDLEIFDNALSRHKYKSVIEKRDITRFNILKNYYKIDIMENNIVVYKFDVYYISKDKFTMQIEIYNISNEIIENLIEKNSWKVNNIKTNYKK